MDAAALDFVTNELQAYITDLRITKEFTYSAPALGIDPLGSVDFTPLTGVTDPHCADALDPERGTEVCYFVEDFFDREDNVCLISQGLWLELEADAILLNVTDPFVNRQAEPTLGKGEVEFTVAGYYPGNSREIYIPFATAQRLCMELSNRRSCDSIAFLAADNSALEALAAAAAPCFGSADPQATEGLALTIRDAQYQATVAALAQNIRRVSYLLPLLLLLALGAGFLISFLSVRNERRTYALMRTLGMTRGKLLASILREQLLLAAAGSILGGLLSRALLPALCYLLCYGTGCLLCSLKTIRVPATTILREQE